MKSTSSGIGDPYWYEWSVGLKYIVEMLNPDNGILSVTFQSSEIDGIDDVVVKFSSGRTKYIQVKHTRDNNNITFGSLVAENAEKADGTKKQSLLKYMASNWKKIHKTTKGEVEVVVFTNRNTGRRKSTALDDSGKKIKRPSLADFKSWLSKQLSSATSFSEINPDEIGKSAWKEWYNQLVDLNSKEKFLFLKALNIKTKQPDLTKIETEIISSLKTYFKVSQDKATTLLVYLDHALREWTTSIRKNEAVNIEEVYRVLSIGNEDMVGDHGLPPPEPFFKSRHSLLKIIKNKCLHGSKPVVFLRGNPASGKTSLINKLANEREPFVVLRFHAFKPITPENNLNSADSDKTTRPEVLWGDLLFQTRKLFEGSLAENSVPLRSDFLSTEEMRAEVLRLGQKWAENNKRKMVIAIDGIDHAARAGKETKTFLETLISPDNVPKDICFLIAGQPEDAYPDYPFWLKCDNPKVDKIEITAIEESDIVDLFPGRAPLFPKDQIGAASRIISSLAQGNTLAAIFALEEIKNISDVNEIEEILRSKDLHNGVEAYYENIWKSVLSRFENHHPYLHYKIAAVFSVLKTKVTPDFMFNVFKEKNISKIDWGHILRDLSPIIIESDGFVVFHNDVRMFLNKKINSDLRRYDEILLQIFNFYCKADWKQSERYHNLLSLLGKISNINGFAEIFSPEFVAGAFASGLTTNEIRDFVPYAVREATAKRNWDLLHQVCTATSTIVQIKNSQQWCGREETESNHVANVLQSEGFVIPFYKWDMELLNKTIEDIFLLVDNHKTDRARGIFERWFKGVSIDALIGKVWKTNNNFPEDSSYENRGVLELFENIGEAIEIFGNPFLKTKGKKTVISNCLAKIHLGRIKRAIIIGKRKKIIRAISRLRVFYINDIEDLVCDLADKKKWFEVFCLLEKFKEHHSDFSFNFRIKASLYSMLLKKEVKLTKWYDFVGDDIFSKMTKKDLDREKDYMYCIISFVLGWKYASKSESEISGNALKSYYSQYGDERNRPHLAKMFSTSAILGRWTGAFFKKGRTHALNFISEEKVGNTLQNIIDLSKNPGVLTDVRNISKKLLNSFIYILNELDISVVAELKDFIEKTKSVGSLAEIIWRYLFDRGEVALLREWMSYWVGENGEIWKPETRIEERFEIPEMFIKLADHSGLEDEKRRIGEKLKFFQIGYSGHKEYSLYTLSAWYYFATDYDYEIWKNEGIKMLGLSKIVSESGDNRASNSVENSVIESAMNVADPPSFWQLINIDKELIPYRSSINQAFKSSIKKNIFHETDLKNMWGTNIGSLYWRKDDSDKELLIEIRDEIKNKLEDKDWILRISPLEAGLKYKKTVDSGERDLERSETEKFVNDIPIEETFKKIGEMFEEKSEHFNWWYLKALAEKIKRENPPEFSRYENKLYEFILKRKESYPWTYDHSHYSFQKIIPLLSNNHQWDIAELLLHQYEDNSVKDWALNSISENLDSLCLYVSRSQENPLKHLKDGFERLYTMHEFWACNDKHLPLSNIPEITADYPSTWAELGLMFLLKKFETMGGLEIETALNGIWIIIENSPEVLVKISNIWCDLNRIQKKFLLMIFEKIANEMPQHFEKIIPTLLKSLDYSDLELKYNAWIALKVYERITGVHCPDIKYEKPENYKEIHQRFNEDGLLLNVNPNSSGMVNTVNSTSSVHSNLIKLEVSVGENIEDVERKVNSLFRSKDAYEKVEKFPNPNETTISGNMIISDNAFSQMFDDVVKCELSDGRWSNVPSIRLIQALCTGEDPYIFTLPFRQSIASNCWSDDKNIEKIINNDIETKKLAKNIIFSDLDNSMDVLGAEVHLFTRDYDIVINYSKVCSRIKEHVGKKHGQMVTFFGRTTALYFDERFDPLEYYEQIPDEFSMTYEARGVSQLLHQYYWCFPSIVWQRFFEWHPKSNNPLIWDVEGKPSIFFEKIAGSERELYHNDRYYRFPKMQRWICKKEILGGVAEKHQLKFKDNISVITNEFKSD